MKRVADMLTVLLAVISVISTHELASIARAGVVVLQTHSLFALRLVTDNTNQNKRIAVDLPEEMDFGRVPNGIEDVRAGRAVGKHFFTRLERYAHFFRACALNFKNEAERDRGVVRLPSPNSSTHFVAIILKGLARLQGFHLVEGNWFPVLVGPVPDNLAGFENRCVDPSLDEDTLERLCDNACARSRSPNNRKYDLVGRFSGQNVA